VSYLSPAGTPQSAVVGIAVTPELELVFDTVASSRKFRNLKARPECSVVLWRGEITMQYEGIAEETTADHYKEAYFKKMPDGRDRLSWPGITYFVVRPKWVRYSDFVARVIEEFSF
jgi:pyridoxine/pyridoxamine 5'-phosphate oxidase